MAKMTCLLYSLTGILIQSLVTGFLFDNGRITVHTAVGDITGFTSSFDINGTRRGLNTFLGIPFAEAPTGVRRFRKPVAKASFKTAFQALDYGPACWQYRAGQPNNRNITFSEDCLSLNIFAPSNGLSNSELYPVMLYIHGGGYLTGYSIGLEGRYLSLSGDVIVVTTNYRLNVFGFLSTGDSGIPSQIHSISILVYLNFFTMFKPIIVLLLFFFFIFYLIQGCESLI